MKKIVKICLISLFLVLTFVVVLFSTIIGINFIKFQSIPLNSESLTEQALSINLYDNSNKPIEEDNQFNGDYCKLSELNEYTKDAFISIEDKDFYKHNGLNKKRIVKAMWNNLKSGSLKEGASTISQQLIKNTHLSNEKTYERKLKEMVLTKKLEANFDKEQILESYLNVIFFGNNCYGIESASKYYFNKNAKELTLPESCTLAGIIKSPSKYSPISNFENSIQRRNLVLSEMEKDGKISVDEKILAQNEPIKLDITQKSSSKINSFSQACIDEASKILNMSAKQLAIGNYHIHTYLDLEKQTAIKDALSNNKIDYIDNCAIVIDSEKCAIVAYCGNSNFKLSETKRQPASCLKPLLVYAPALNEDIISPSTQILDEPLKIGDYSPTNVNKKFNGYVSITDAVKNSINIPAIKVLSYIGIDTGKQYAEKLGIQFDEKDDSYSLALGGMTYGTTLQSLTNAYSVFPNKGYFGKASFVQYITDENNKLVYSHKPTKQMVLREDSAYLMTSILQETAKTGTARKLSEITNTALASKTGTVGKKSISGNTDAYNISFTPSEVIGVWYGSLENNPSKIAGGNQPTEVVKEYVASQNYEKNNFETPSSVTTVLIDSLEKEENHRIVLANPYSPNRYTEECLFSRFNTPTDISTNFSNKPKINAECKVENSQIILSLTAEKHLYYQIYKDNLPYQTINEKQGNLTFKLHFPENKATIKITAKYTNSNNETIEAEETFNLIKTSNTSESTTQKKWYI